MYRALTVLVAYRMEITAAEAKERKPRRRRERGRRKSYNLHTDSGNLRKIYENPWKLLEAKQKL